MSERLDGWPVEHYHRMEEALKLFADPESWEVVSRSGSDWDEHVWQGDDGEERPWEFAQKALEE